MTNEPNHLEDFFGFKGEQEPEKESIRHHIFRRRSNLGDRIRLLPKVLSKTERYFILAFIVIIVASIVAIPFTIYDHFTVSVPAYGGSLTEGIVGQPRHINPVLAQANSSDRDLSGLIYSGLLKYNPDGKLVPDLADHYEVSSDGLNYTFYIKDDATWQDGQPVTADDVVYTIQTVQNPDYGSPSRGDWEGVSAVKINDKTVIFKLDNPYAQFLNNLTLGIIPEHIWAGIQAINFPSADYNLKPLGSGPYMFNKLQKDSNGNIQSYQLVSNKNYYDGRPYIDTIDFKFYNSEDDMIAAYNRNEIQDLATVSAQNLSKLKFVRRLNIQQIKIPLYFAVFFNQTQNKNLGDGNVRLALNYATDKQSIINQVANGKATAIYSPLIEDVLDVNQDFPKYTFDLNKAKQILTADGWVAGADGILKKGNNILAINITTSTDFPELVQTADLLKDQWAKAGVQVTVNALGTNELNQAIKNRAYDSLLFGAIVDLDPDPFGLWDSSQVQKPGLNLALYSNKTADSLLESARQTLNPLDRAQKYNDFQTIVINDAPAVFLYNPTYLYPQTTAIHGSKMSVIFSPSDRFDNIDKWYINTTRKWK